jgi:hypothetical protein
VNPTGETQQWVGSGVQRKFPKQLVGRDRVRRDPESSRFQFRSNLHFPHKVQFSASLACSLLWICSPEPKKKKCISVLVPPPSCGCTQLSPLLPLSPAGQVQPQCPTVCQNLQKASCQWLTPVIPATQEAEIRRIARFEVSSGK